MNVTKPSVEIIDMKDYDEMIRKIEKIGRVCYKSEGNITEESAERFIRNILKRGHESVIEHEAVTVRMICDRGITHEIVRHRIAMGMNVFSSQDVGFSGLSLDDRIFLAQSKVIRNVAKEGPCVIVGRCADYILKNQENVVNLFIRATLDFRIKRAIEVEGIPKEKSAEMVMKKDKSRANYYKYHSGERWDNVLNYDFAIRSDLCGIDGTVACLKAYLDQM